MVSKVPNTTYSYETIDKKSFNTEKEAQKYEEGLENWYYYAWLRNLSQPKLDETGTWLLKKQTTSTRWVEGVAGYLSDSKGYEHVDVHNKNCAYYNGKLIDAIKSAFQEVTNKSVMHYYFFEKINIIKV